MKSRKKEELQKGCFDEVYTGVISGIFSSIKDNREENKSYSLSDVLKAGFAIFSLKAPSLLSFRKMSRAEDSNIKSIYGISQIPSDNGLRQILDEVCPDSLRKGFKELFTYVKSIKILDNFKYWNNYLTVSVDGVEFFKSSEVHCDKCMERKHKDGKTSYYHSMLSAVIVHPERKEVLVLDNEPIVKQDGQHKNDCERNAGKRLISNFKSLYTNELMVFTFDALYACGPIIEQLNEVKNWRYVIGIKEKGNKHLFEQFDKKNKDHKVNWHTVKNDEGSHEFGYINNAELNASSAHLGVNMLYYIWTNKKGEDKVFSWITNIKLNKSSVFQIMKIGRSRWKIENETFNTLKNQGYNFTHNYGHGENNLCTIFAYLMMLAFYVDQLQQYTCSYFKKLLFELKTRVKLWDAMRAVFKILPRKNMTELFFSIAEMYQIRLI